MLSTADAARKFVVSDDHEGLKRAIREVLPERHGSAATHLPRKAHDDCLRRWMHDRRDLAEVERVLAQWLARWQAKYLKPTSWLRRTSSFYRQPLARPNQEIRRHTHVVRIFPKAASCLRLVRALVVKAHENCSRPPAISTWRT